MKNYYIQIRKAPFYIFSFLCYFILFSQNLHAQSPQDPSINCVLNDTLFWTAAVNECGPLLEWSLLASQIESGPYEQIAQNNDNDIVSFLHENPGGVWYYQLHYTYDCAMGQETLISEIVDNLQPPLVTITSASVLDQDVQLEWQLSNAPEVIEYIIYRETDLGVIPIGNVSNTNTFLDTGANPNEMVENYWVLARDLCDQTSIYGDPHMTMLLMVTKSDCDNFISLNWTPYAYWIEGIDRYEIWLDIDGQGPEYYDQVPPDSLSYQYSEINIEADYCFEIRAIEKNKTYSASSNTNCFALVSLDILTNFSVANISHAADNPDSVAITWVWNPNVNIQSYEIEKIIEENNSLGLGVQMPTTIDYLNATGYIEGKVNHAVSYQVKAIDACQNIVTTSPSSTIYLSGISDDQGTARLAWTPLHIKDLEVYSYDVFQITHNGREYLGTVDGTSLSFQHNQVVERNTPFYTYQVVAIGRVKMFDNSYIDIESYSNEGIITLKSKIYVPNALVPEGQNNEFRAVILFPENLDFQLEVYNRYGQRVFETKDPFESWTGNENGKPAPSGTYVYVIKATTVDGEIIEKSGNLMLIR